MSERELDLGDNSMTGAVVEEEPDLPVLVDEDDTQDILTYEGPGSVEAVPDVEAGEPL